MTRARPALALAAALGLALAGCTPAAQVDVLPERFVDLPEISPAAQQAYGERAEEAYDQLADLLLEQATPEALLDPGHGTPTEAELVDGIVEAMTDEAAQEWRATVAADLGGDQQARDVVRLLRFHTWEAPGYAAPRVGDTLRSQSVTDGSVTTDAAGTQAPEGLVVSLTHHAQVRLVAAQVPVDVELERPLTVTLVPDGDAWLIDTFEGSLHIPSAVPGGGDGSTTTPTTGPAGG